MCIICMNIIRSFQQNTTIFDMACIKCKWTMLEYTVMVFLVIATGVRFTSGFTLDYVGCYHKDTTIVALTEAEYKASHFQYSSTYFNQSIVHVACQATCMTKGRMYFGVQRHSASQPYARCFCGIGPGSSQNESKCSLTCDRGDQCGGEDYNSVFRVFTDIGCLNMAGVRADYTVTQTGNDDIVTAQCRNKCVLDKETPFFGIRQGTLNEKNHTRVKCYCIQGSDLDYKHLQGNDATCSNECSGEKCGGNGKISSIYTVCPANHFGVDNNTSNATCTQPCLYNSTVYDPTGGNCTACHKGLTGQLCLEDNDECLSGEHNCDFPLVCHNTHGGFTCNCTTGYTSEEDTTVCTDVDECMDDTICGPLVCNNTVGGYICQCSSGYEENDVISTCVDVNKCASDEILCDPWECHNTDDTFECTCPSRLPYGPTYTYNDNKTACVDFDECSHGINWCPHGSCVNTIGHFKCVNCTDGYQEGWSGVCVDINECANRSICGDGMRDCSNLDGTYQCHCDDGYNLINNNTYCKDKDECQFDNGGCNHNCSNTAGSFHCTCMTGYQMSDDERTCADTDECLDTTVCLNGKCHNHAGGYSCLCEDGYFPSNDSQQCQDDDECLKNNGDCSDLCNNTQGSYICSCPLGYILLGDKKTCNETDECYEGEDNCTHNCTNTAGSFYCSCLDGYLIDSDKITCIDIDECIAQVDDCEHVCINQPGDYICSCMDDDYLLMTDGRSCQKNGVPLAVIAGLSVLIVFLMLAAGIVVYCFILNKSGTSLAQEWRGLSRRKAKRARRSEVSVSLEVQTSAQGIQGVNIQNNVKIQIGTDYSVSSASEKTQPHRNPVGPAKPPRASKYEHPSNNRDSTFIEESNQIVLSDPGHNRVTEDSMPKGTPRSTPKLKLKFKPQTTEGIYCNVGSEAPMCTMIHLSDFVDYVNKIKVESADPFKSEYDALPQEPCFSWDYAVQPELKGKNRFKNILPYDMNRVRLRSVEGDPLADYINASHIQGYTEKDKLIAALGPRPNTVDDFWRMIWEHNCHLVVMLTNLVEAGVTKCQQYWPDNGSKQYGGIHVTATLFDVKPDYVVRRFRISDCEGQSRGLTHYHFTVWPDHGVPRYAGALIEFRRRVARSSIAGKPTIVHCSAGIGRTGTLIALDYLLKQAETEGAVDVFSLVKSFREQRSGMVQTWAQYVFLHNALAEYFTIGETSIPNYAVRDTIESLSKTDKDGVTAYETQLRLLEASSPIVDVYDTREFLNPENKPKNRSSRIIPRSGKIIVLSTEMEDRNSYINAVSVNSYLRKKCFIATQIPLENTVIDFWRMIHEQQSKIIVMIITEDQLKDIPDFLPVKEQPMTLAGFSVVSYDASHGFPVGLTAKNLTLVKSATDDLDTDVDCGQDYINTVDIIPGKSVCEVGVKMFILTLDRGQRLLPAAMTSELISRVKTTLGPDKTRPVVIMSMDGCGLCGQYIASSNLLEMINTDKEFDIYQICRQIKDSRPEFIGDVDQYIHLFSMAQDFVGDFDIYSS